MDEGEMEGKLSSKAPYFVLNRTVTGSFVSQFMGLCRKRALFPWLNKHLSIFSWWGFSRQADRCASIAWWTTSITNYKDAMRHLYLLLDLIIVYPYILCLLLLIMNETAFMFPFSKLRVFTCVQACHFLAFLVWKSPLVKQTIDILVLRDRISRKAALYFERTGRFQSCETFNLKQQMLGISG